MKSRRKTTGAIVGLGLLLATACGSGDRDVSEVGFMKITAGDWSRTLVGAQHSIITRDGS